jgi:hypothetical protein
MVAFPAVMALTYVSASFWSVSRVHAALAFDAKAKPARAIKQNVMATLTLSLFIYASPWVLSRLWYVDLPTLKKKKAHARRISQTAIEFCAERPCESISNSH